MMAMRRYDCSRLIPESVMPSRLHLPGTPYVLALPGKSTVLRRTHGARVLFRHKRRSTPAFRALRSFGITDSGNYMVWGAGTA